MSRRIDARGIKTRATYTVEELARLLGLHRQTVRQWVKSGLPLIDDQRPALILGAAALSFLAARRSQRSQRCADDEMYCLRCRAPRKPDGGLVDYLPITPSSGNLRGLCGACGALMHRRTGVHRLDDLGHRFEIGFPQGDPRVRDRPTPCLNAHMTDGADA